jgi:hypothetical protein
MLDVFLTIPAKNEIAIRSNKRRFSDAGVTYFLILSHPLLSHRYWSGISYHGHELAKISRLLGGRWKRKY